MDVMTRDDARALGRKKFFSGIPCANGHLAERYVRKSLHAKRRSSKKRAVPLWFSEFDAFVWNEAAELAIRRKAATGINWHVDHMIPLSARKASGLHVASNCQVIPQVLNNRKHNKLVLTSPGEWIAHL